MNCNKQGTRDHVLNGLWARPTSLHDAEHFCWKCVVRRHKLTFQMEFQIQMRVWVTYYRSSVRDEHAFALLCLSFVMLGRKSKSYLAFARLLNYCYYVAFPMSFPWNYRDQHNGDCWIQANMRMEKPGPWRQHVDMASFNFFVHSNFGVWLEVTQSPGNGSVKAESSSIEEGSPSESHSTRLLYR